MCLHECAGARVDTVPGRLSDSGGDVARGEEGREVEMTQLVSAFASTDSKTKTTEGYPKKTQPWHLFWRPKFAISSSRQLSSVCTIVEIETDRDNKNASTLIGKLRNLALLRTNLILGLQHLPEKVDSVVLRYGHGNRLMLTGSRRRLAMLLVLRLLCN